ncbi:MAG: electron transfer flavoprotein subunit alpha [Lachnospiraceae bacterium]|nr:electron transfer flavoprotein subunit alpha [Lachnospiraceae bacterium]
MNLLKFNSDKCSLCRECMRKCPFNALSMDENGLQVGETCKMCGVCVKVCPTGALKFEQKAGSEDKSKWRDILIYGEIDGDKIHPVVYELIGEGLKLAAKVNYKVNVVMVGKEGTSKLAEDLLYYGVENVYVYEHAGFEGFKADCYTDAVADCISEIRPSVVLVGATSVGRSLAPRMATRFHTGLTADCTKLEMRENSDLVQIRPAFGGNVMAQILIADARPQFATVRYKVMKKAIRRETKSGRVVKCEATDKMALSRIELISRRVIEHVKSIEEEDVLIVAGRGVTKDEDMELLKKLASLLKGQLAFTRPMVENGFGDTAHQIGLSGRTVKPKLIMTFGVSGAIQFAAGMSTAETIVAVNKDENALIFNIADYAIVDDLSDVLPALVESVERARS